MRDKDFHFIIGYKMIDNAIGFTGTHFINIDSLKFLYIPIYIHQTDKSIAFNVSQSLLAFIYFFNSILFFKR